MDGITPSQIDADQSAHLDISNGSQKVALENRLHQPELDRKFRAIWDFGRVALIGYNVADNELSVLAAPILQALQTGALKPQLAGGAGLIDVDTMATLAKELGVAPVQIDLDNPFGSPTGPTHFDIVSIMRPYCISTTKQRAVGLLDIYEFSLFSPEEQAAQLSMLSYALNSAHQRLSEAGLNIDLACSTTGNGFFIWNRHEGLDEDASLFCLMTVALAHMAAQYQVGFAPAIRACFGIDGYYTFFRPDPENGMGDDYIVGDVTIVLSSLIDSAIARQIMISDFSRIDKSGHAVGAEEFLEMSCRIFDDLQIIRIGDAKLVGVLRYLTGPQNDDGTYAIRKREFTDKQGAKHYAYNVKLNISLAEDGQLYLGRQEPYAA